MKTPFLDTNILVRHLRQDHTEHSPKATAYIGQIEKGKIQVCTSDVVVFETVYLLQKTYKIPKQAIGEVLLPLLELPNIKLPGKRQYRRVFDLYTNLNISFPDAYHVVFMEKRGLTQVVSFDKGFDKARKASKVTRIKL